MVEEITINSEALSFIVATTFATIMSSIAILILMWRFTAIINPIMDWLFAKKVSFNDLYSDFEILKSEMDHFKKEHENSLDKKISLDH